MNTAIPTPPPERLPVLPEHNPECAPKRDEAHVCHDGFDVAALQRITRILVSFHFVSLTTRRLMSSQVSI
jgi:hypothetical protein